MMTWYANFVNLNIRFWSFYLFISYFLLNEGYEIQHFFYHPNPYTCWYSLLHIQHNYFHIKQILILDKDSPSKYERFWNDYII